MKTVIEMAEACGIPEFSNNESQVENIMAFAKLVAAAERKRITDLIRSERYGIGSMCSQWTDEEVAQDIEYEMKDSKEKP